jgi:hypothetical protein
VKKHQILRKNQEKTKKEKTLKFFENFKGNIIMLVKYKILHKKI